MSSLELADRLLKAGNAAAALRLLRDSGAPGPARDLRVARCCLRLGDTAGALAAWLAVLAADPRQVEAASAAAAVYLRQNLPERAEALLARSLQCVDDDQLRVDHAVVLHRLGQHERALAALAQVMARSPGHFAARHQHASLLLALGRHEEAAAALRGLLQDFPERPEPAGLLGVAEFHCGRYESAAALLREACRREPGVSRHLKSLALAQALSGDIEPARATLAELRRRDPALWREVATAITRRPAGEEEIDPRPYFLVKAYQQQEACDWQRRARFEAVMRDFIADPGHSNPFPLAHLTGLVPLTAQERLRYARRAAAVVGRGLQPVAHVPSPAPAKLRVGYVLARLGPHVVALILRTLLAAHDREAVEVHVVVVGQTGADAQSEVPARYAAVPGLACHDLTALDDAAAAARLRELCLDVLVDLSVYNDGARPGILARRPAPVQVSYLGAPFTSGAPWLDYIITDPVVTPEDREWCTEAEVTMPVCYFAYGHEDAQPPPVPPRAALGLPEERFLFSGLTNPYKIDPADLDCWGRILAATPGSLLLLKDQHGSAAFLRREAEKRGIDPARLLFAPVVSARDYLLRQGMPDLFLDTRCYGAHTTLAESLWMGVPALSCRGSVFQNRVGASLLASCGLQELVAPDPEAYEALAIALFHDRDRLRRLKAQLLAVRAQAAPFDLPGQARHLERAFRHMRQRFADGLPPAPFAIADLPD